MAEFWNPTSGAIGRGPGGVVAIVTSLAIMINIIVLWQTVYVQAALNHLAANGYPLDPADIARLSPLGHPTINLDGRYRTTSHPPATRLRPLRGLTQDPA